MPTVPGDRRANSRHTVQDPHDIVIHRTENGKPFTAAARLRDISPDGLRFDSPANLPLGAEIVAHIAGRGFPQAVDVKGTVLWADALGSLDGIVHAYGMKFADTAAPERLALLKILQSPAFGGAPVADRRRADGDRQPGRREGSHFDPVKREFSIYTDVTFGYTSAAVNAYFARYFDWQGVLREKWLFKFVPDWMEKLADVRQITYHAENFYKYPVYFGDNVALRLRVRELSRVKLIFGFSFVKLLNGKDGPVFAEGSQTILFGKPDPKNPVESKLIPVPDCIRRGCKPFLPAS